MVTYKIRLPPVLACRSAFNDSTISSKIMTYLKVYDEKDIGKRENK